MSDNINSKTINNIENPIYSFEDTAAIEKEKRVDLVCASVYLVLCVVVVTLTLVVRSQLASNIATIALGSTAIFIWSMVLSPRFAYRRHLRGIAQGLTRKAEGVVVSVDSTPSFHDGIYVREILVRTGEGKVGERLFYLDEKKRDQRLVEGATVRITSHGNYIVGLAIGER